MTGVLLYYIFLYKQAKHLFFVYSNNVSVNCMTSCITCFMVGGVNGLGLALLTEAVGIYMGSKLELQNQI